MRGCAGLQMGERWRTLGAGMTKNDINGGSEAAQAQSNCMERTEAWEDGLGPWRAWRKLEWQESEMKDRAVREPVASRQGPQGGQALQDSLQITHVSRKVLEGYHMGDMIQSTFLKDQPEWRMKNQLEKKSTGKSQEIKSKGVILYMVGDVPILQIRKLRIMGTE